ncbi:MAG: tail fiber domain-containing protein [Bacteroidota bacterium]
MGIVNTNAIKGKLILGIFTDTVAANLDCCLKNYDGALIKTTSPINGIWYRNLALYQWIQVGSGGGGSGWNLTGNAGTTAGTNFLGTTDNVSLVFKANNIEAGKIDLPLSNTSFGYQSMGNTSTGNQNTAFGYQSLNSVITGASNTAVGYTAMATNNGSSNTALGMLTMNNNQTGSNNIALGYRAGYFTSNQSNRLFIGSMGLTSNVGQDTTMHIIYGAQDATAGSQRLYLNSQVYLPYLNSGVGTKAVRINPGTGLLTYADTTTGGGGGSIGGSISTNQVAYGSGSNTITGLAVNATGTQKFLAQTSSGAPVWAVPSGSLATFFNVIPYGAVGDSTTNETTAFQDAIDAAHVNGGTVYAPAGQYSFNTLTFYSNVKIMGDGNGTRFYSRAAEPMFQSVNTSFNTYTEINYCTLSDIYLDGRGIGTIGVNLQNAALLNFQNMQVYRFDTACKIRGIIIANFDNFDAEQGLVGIDVDKGPPSFNLPTNIINITRSRFTYLTQWAVHFTNGSGLSISGLTDFEANGTSSDSTTGCVKMAYPYITNDEGLGLSLKGNWFENNSGVTVDIEDGGVYKAKHIIEDNTFIVVGAGNNHTIKTHIVGGFAGTVEVYLARNHFENTDSYTIDGIGSGSGNLVKVYYYDIIDPSITTSFTSSSQLLSTTVPGGSTTELQYNNAGVLSGITGATTSNGINVTLTSPTIATALTGSYLTASELLGTDASKNIVSLPVASYPSLTELTYVKGVTSALQPQIDARATSLNPTFTGTVTGPISNWSGLLSANAKAVVTGATLGGASFTDNFLNVTGTFPATSGAGVVAGVYESFTTAGSSGAQLIGSYINLAAGHTGTGPSNCMVGDNAVAGTGTALNLNATSTSPAGNNGFVGYARATTTGSNIGGFAEASAGNINIGYLGKATTNKNSATNIGIAAFALNTGSSPIQVGAYFGLQNATPTFASAALMADNGSQTSDIFVARDNGTATFTIADGGGVTTTSLAGSGSRAVLADANGLLSAPVSDIRAKWRVNDLDYGINTIMKLHPVSFYYKKGWQNYGKQRQVGFIAQEIENVMPNSVFTTPKTGLKGYNEIDIVPILTKAMQEQQLEIQELKKQVNELRLLINK